MSEENPPTLEERIVEQMTAFNVDGNVYHGPGWDLLKEKITEHPTILVGEDHFAKEIPELIAAMGQLDTFDHFYIEVDPYSTKIIEEKLALPEEEVVQFRKENGHMLSFYSLEPEWNLLTTMVKSGSKLLGIDQILMNADRLLCEELARTASSDEVKNIFTNIARKSKEAFATFLQNPEVPNYGLMYMLTSEFQDDLNALELLDLADYEAQIVKDMRLSAEIYQKQSHNTRVKLLLSHVLKNYPIWSTGKTLFKYGASHMMRGESILYVHDIGNLVASIARANFSSSYHIMIIGMAGEVGSPFQGFPARKIDSEGGFYLSHLQPFFDLIRTQEDQAFAYVFDLRPMRLDLIRERYKVDKINLERILKGFDMLIILTVVTAAQFPNF